MMPPSSMDRLAGVLAVAGRALIPGDGGVSCFCGWDWPCWRLGQNLPVVCLFSGQAALPSRMMRLWDA